MADYNMFIFLITVPLGIALVNIFLPALLKKILTFLGLIFTMHGTWIVYSGGAENYMLWNYVILSIDKMGIFALAFIQILSFIILIFSLKGVEETAENRFFVLYPLTIAFCNGVVLSENAIAFLTFWGLSGITLYLFALLGQSKDTPSMAKKTFILIGGSDAFLIMGIAIMAFLKPEAGWSMNAYGIPLINSLGYVAFFFLLIAAFTKAGGFPFHTWIPDFAREAPIESSAFLPASLDKLLGIYLLARMMTTLFVVDVVINLIVITLGAITVISAVMMAMDQHNGRKLLGYHAVSQVGYMIMGVGSGHVLAFAGGLFHMINHTIYKSNLFLSLGSVEKQAGTCELDNLSGLSKKMPITFLIATIGALSISGIPPFNGFFSKWMIYQGLIDLTSGLSPGLQLWLLLCIILAVFGSALTLASFMKFLHSIFLGKRPARHDNVKEAPANQWIGTGLLALLCVVFGVFAIELPLRGFIYPLIADSGMQIPNFIGLYNPQLLVVLLFLGFLFAILVYRIVRKVRFDEIYLGGMQESEQFRVAGTEFYNEIRFMKPLKSIYEAAEKKFFDLYDLSGKLTFGFSGLFQRVHPGQVQLYLLYIIIGFLVFIWVI